jgi:hypothetical protein
MEVARRWWHLFPKRRDSEGRALPPKEKELELIVADAERAEELRWRLGDISWIMRCLNEYIARKANQEDNCTGRFWEGRFHCQALLDEAAVLTCMAYVDLNPIRAKIAEKPEESEFTSVKERIDARQAKSKIKTLNKKRKDLEQKGHPLTQKQQEALRVERAKSMIDRWMNPIGIQKVKRGALPSRKGFLSISLDEYLALLDWTGRCIKTGKRGAIPQSLKPIMERLEIDVENWVDTVLSFGRMFYRVAGTVKKIVERAHQVGQAFFKGISASRAAFALPSNM